MDNFNRIISFVLGLIVVIVFIVIITGRFNLKEKFLGKANITKTPTPTITPTRSASPPTPSRYPTATPLITGVYNQPTPTPYGKKPSTIPSTGSPTLLLSFLFSSLGAGIFLKKKG